MSKSSALRLGQVNSGILRRSNVLSSSAFGARILSSSRLFSTVIDEQLMVALKTPSSNRNITPNILEKVGRNLHLIDKHPLGIIKGKIEEYFNKYTVEKGQQAFEVFDKMSPYVNVKNCFDDLRVGPDHVSRRPSDTYYVDEKHVLRTHTSAHQNQLISGGKTSFLCTGDVYRRDEIDSSHYPVFHQMEGNEECQFSRISMQTCLHNVIIPFSLTCDLV